MSWSDFTRGRKITKPHWYFEAWGLFAYSFKQSADLVYAEFKETRRDIYSFPSIYLYRQWMELGLKSAWRETVRLGSSLGPVPKTHDLPKLWAGIRPWLVQSTIVSAEDQYLQSAERAFSVLNALDPDGTAFRYPPIQLPHRDIINISLDDFERAIDEVDTIFFGLSAMFEQYEDYMAHADHFGSATSEEDRG
jgi:hypothetical protein